MKKELHLITKENCAGIIGYPYLDIHKVNSERKNQYYSQQNFLCVWMEFLLMRKRPKTF